MVSLLHLNGPPGIGKSTLAALWADRHPGVLNLDIDALHPLVGGWRDDVSRTHHLLRPVARAMAATHLRGGHDVVLPQYLARLSEIEAFERIAHDAGARFIEVVLLAEKDDAVARFDRPADAGAWQEHNRRFVAAHGGPLLLGEMFDALLDAVALRPSAVVLRTEFGAIEDSYAQIERAVGAG